jgi:hypothetical protein
MRRDKSYDGGHFVSVRGGMSKVDEVVNKQKEGAQFVISAQMLRLAPEEFDTLANIWIADGGPGFEIAGVPHRRCIDGEFFIDRITVVKTAAAD